MGGFCPDLDLIAVSADPARMKSFTLKYHLEKFYLENTKYTIYDTKSYHLLAIHVEYFVRKMVGKNVSENAFVYILISLWRSEYQMHDFDFKLYFSINVFLSTRLATELFMKVNS